MAMTVYICCLECSVLVPVVASHHVLGQRARERGREVYSPLRLGLKHAGWLSALLLKRATPPGPRAVR